uniref:Lipase n=1 Tax=Rhipicephalus microplus TaxID=6941 RepID=A0A6M2CH00_RHIMP
MSWLLELLLLCVFVAADGTKRSTSDVERQVKMTTCELVADMGYHCETRKATTEDGYVVEIDRVRENAKAAACDRETCDNPVLLVPGMLDDSASWFLNQPSQSAGFMLADKGYDVWTMNTREITNRCEHKELSHSDPRYWEWSFNEIGKFDVAAAIDLVLTTTGASTLVILAFSQGFTSSLVLLSTKPEYNAKVDLLMGYGPVANVSHTGYPLSALLFFSDLIFPVIDPFGKRGYFSFTGAAEATGKPLCSILDGGICSATLFIALAATPEQVNKTRTPVYMAHTYQATSIKNLHHLVQVAKSKRFAMYDNGKVDNLLKYGKTEPPEYPLERISVPAALFSAVRDKIANPVDVADLVRALDAGVVLNYVLPMRNFHHDDFILSCKAAHVLHDVMIATLANYTSNDADEEEHVPDGAYISDNLG